MQCSPTCTNHTPEEIAALVEEGFLAADVTARLEPEKQYCVWWYHGRDYDGEEHRVAVPVPDSGIPREWVDAARATLKDNATPSKAGDRECWQLSGGFLFCAGCGRRMQTQAAKGPRDGVTYLYYRCATNQETTKRPCPTNVRLHAERVETATWKFVSELLSNPNQIVAWLERGIEQERRRLRRDPQEDLRQLHERLGAIKRRRGAFQNQQADGLMTLDELRERLADLEEAAEAVERQIQACETRGEGLRSLEEMKQFYLGKGSLWEVIKPLDEWTQISTPEGEWKVRVPFDDQVKHMRNVAHQARLEALAKHTPEERRERYRELDLRVVAHSKEEIEVSGLFDPERIYISAPSSTSPP
jgi:Recombinase zinc beta ribbon domain